MRTPRVPKFTRAVADRAPLLERPSWDDTSATTTTKVPQPGRRPEVDQVDRDLIALLTANGRTTNRALAAEVGLTEPTVAARVRSLANLRVLGVTATLDWAAAGYTWDAWLQVSVKGRPVKEVGAELASLDVVHLVNLVFGPFDLLVHILLADESAAIDVIDRQIGGIRGVYAVRPSVTLETIKFETKHARIPIRPIRLSFPNPVIDLDPLDFALINALVGDGRQSNREAARNLGVSEGTVRVRLRRMEEAGLLRITARSDPYLTGELNAWATIGVATERGASRSVAGQLAAMSETTIVTLLAGAEDILASVATATRSRLVDLVLEEVRAITGVRSTATWDLVSTATLSYQWARLL